MPVSTLALAAPVLSAEPGVVTDIAIGLALLAIPVIVVRFTRRRGTGPAPWALGLFSAFMCIMGLAHVVEALGAVWGDPELAGALDLAGAVLAWASVVALLPLLPAALSVRTAKQLEVEIQARVEDARRSDAEREAAQLANRAKDEFLANVSHEIRTPMTAIMGFADLLTDPEIRDDERLEHIETIRRNGSHLLSILNDILDISKIEAGKLTVESVPCSPLHILEEVLSLMRVRATGKGLSLEVEYQPPLPREIRSDPLRLRQILVNLVGNAIKFTEFGGVTVAVGLSDPMDDGRPRLVFRVTDTGIGIRQDQLATLFNAFGQADASTTRRFGGTGLGLAISKRLAIMLGGDIEAESTPGLCSTFTVMVDPGPFEGVELLDAPPAALERATANAEQWEHRIAFGRVLLAEDGPDNRRLLSFVLRKVGLDVDVAENGRVAVEKAIEAESRGEGFDLILMDMQMPVMDGYQATRKLRVLGYRGPVVAVTAHAMGGDAEKCLAAGCDDYVSKPIEHADFLGKVMRYCGHREPLQAPVQPTPAPVDGVEPMVSTLAGDPGLEEVLQMFLDGLADRMADIEVAVEARDTAGLRTLVHQLKGAGGSYGLMPLSRAAADFEQIIRSGASDEQIEDAKQELFRLCRRAMAAAPPVREQPAHHPRV